MKNWSSVKTFTLSGSAQAYRDTEARFKKHAFYRLVTVPAPGSGGPSTILPDLADSTDVFAASEGFDTVQYSASGKLGFIFWKAGNLTIRERDTGGSWSEQSITGGGSTVIPNTRENYKFQPAAILLYDSGSNPHVFKVNGNTTVSHFTRNGSAWTQSELITNPQASASLGMLVGAVGANDVFHLGVISNGDNPNLTYGVKKNGQWGWSKVADIGAMPRNHFTPSYASRWFSLAADKNNAAHIVFRPALVVSYHPQGYVRAYNELHYASNASGQWQREIVHKPDNVSAEAGNGQSVAIGPDGKPYVASWYNERADTGSAQWSRLLYHQKDDSGKWVNSIVVSRPDSTYQAGDGEKGTGFAPYLRFDAKGRAHILFSDHAAEHFWVSGQSEYAGQIRHAWWNGSGWQFETVAKQSGPTQQQMVYPAFAMSGSELAVTGLQRHTNWDMNVYPPTVTSTYRFSFLTKPLQ